ncbi:uncharacterized protein LOC114266592 [Camellia sinensis]|uniref:uncharacterized protein LOC114266592 n=1 Tax=Camellia sinensis TaxID=4442 RepID=UPI00103564DA|nr:uncharacterized protein LOC114266592 [Camellia sinensis]
MSVAEFEEVFSSLSQFAPELVATEEHRCIEFEKKLKTKILFKVAGNMIWNDDRLVEAAAHIKITVEAEEERIRGSRSRGQGVKGHRRTIGPIRKAGTDFHPSPNRNNLDLFFPCLVWAQERKSAPSGFSCFNCGQLGHKAFVCPQKGG